MNIQGVVKKVKILEQFIKDVYTRTLDELVEDMEVVNLLGTYNNHLEFHNRLFKKMMAKVGSKNTQLSSRSLRFGEQGVLGGVLTTSNSCLYNERMRELSKSRSIKSQKKYGKAREERISGEVKQKSREGKTERISEDMENLIRKINGANGKVGNLREREKVLEGNSAGAGCLKKNFFTKLKRPEFETGSNKYSKPPSLGNSNVKDQQEILRNPENINKTSFEMLHLCPTKSNLPQRGKKLQDPPAFSNISSIRSSLPQHSYFKGIETVRRSLENKRNSLRHSFKPKNNLEGIFSKRASRVDSQLRQVHTLSPSNTKQRIAVRQHIDVLQKVLKAVRNHPKSVSNRRGSSYPVNDTQDFPKP